MELVETAITVRGGVRAILRMEGAALAFAAIAAYAHLGGRWPLFAVLILAPDLSFLGYLAGARVGAAAYNAAHSTVAPILFGAFGAMLGHPLAILIALIWIAHVGFDRAMGYGLKYASGFRNTHLGLIGRK
ncbi:MAG TPA: DUF4260 domain-containing protein [Rhizomicrobium sp.]